jgi:pilus assembly protein FimV
MRSLTLCGALALLAAPFGAWALSLGEIDIRSALNQPLEAEIELSATAEELQSLNVTLASPETFARYGLDRPGFLANLEFRVGTNSAGRNVILVRSRQSIAEPFVEMLVEASSRSGRLLRQYTVFLDPPTLLPQAPLPAAIQPAQTRPPEPVAGGAIPRTPAPQPAVTPSPAAPAPAVAPAPGTAAGGTYGPVQNAETLWGIAEQFRPNGVTMNQMMVAVFQANPQAFDGNMNVLRRGAILRIPELTELQSVNAGNATAEVQRQSDAWQGAPAERQARLTLLPASDEAAPAGAARGPETPAGAATSDAEVAALRDEVGALQTELEESRRLLELRNDELRRLQEQLSRDPEDAASPDPEAPAVAADPGVGLEAEQLFADEPPAADEPPIAVQEPEPEVEAPPAAPVTPPGPAATVTTQPSEPSLVQQILGWLATPIVWIAVGAGVVLLGLFAFLRRRRDVPAEDVTGQWEALEAEVEADDVEREATARMRRQAARDDDFLVHEQHVGDDDEPAPAPAARSPHARESALETRAGEQEPEAEEHTLSSQTVINLDQADPVAEADFHMAYGLYDQAADLVSKALKAEPDSRELKLKLLEVFFVWGNKESFLNSAQALRREMGGRPDADWDKVIIMGKQICPDEPLFADATAAAGELDIDLVAGDAPALDLAFDEAAGADIDLDLGEFDSTGIDFETDATEERGAARSGRGTDDESATLDIGERTQAGLEEALFQLDEAASETTPDLDMDSLAVTQESPTVETAKSGFGADEWSAPTMENPTIEAAGPGGTATVESPSFDDEDDYATVETPTVESPFGRFGEHGATVEVGAGTGEFTAELNLDDLGLDISDVDGLPQDLGELPSADDGESDTREQPGFGADSDLLSATGVTQVLRDDGDDLEHLSTEVFGAEDETMMASDFENDSAERTSILKQPPGRDSDDEELDLNLDDFSSALQGGDTVEQPRTSSFGRGIFDDDGSTPIDLDVGADIRGDDEPTGTEDVGPLDPQTMTEVGTKLDLARAYIDMGDPEGARSILEEVLDEGDSGQRREAQSLIDMLPA